MAGIGGDGNPHPEGNNRLLVEAIMAQMQRMMREQTEELYGRLEQLENQANLGEGDPNGDRRRHERRRRRDQDGDQREDRNEGVKVNIPPFKGRSDPEAYIEWEMKVEQLFSCHTLTEERKIKLATLEFTDYALVWWDQFQKERRRYREPMLETWKELKRVLRRRFVPSHYHRDLHNRLQRLTQGSKSVDQYYKELEIAMICANVEEDGESTMARFLNGLNGDIRDVVELQNYVEIEDLVHHAMKVEQQLKRKGMRKNSSNFDNSWWKERNKKEGTSSLRAPMAVPQSTQNKGKEVQNKSRTRDIKCFRCLGRGHIASACPTKKTMVLKANGEITSESSQSEYSSGEKTKKEGEEIPEGDLFIVRRMLGGLAKESEENQRENIFHTRCLIQGKVCSLIIDGGSCTNVASTRLVTKMNLETKPHPRPYKLQWLSEEGELKVDKQVDIVFSIGKYEDKVVCDVVPMEASHLLLGRPWQYDKNAQHDGHTNKYTFVHNDRKVTLVPLSPREVCEDQNKMREKRAQERKEKKEDENEGKRSERGQEQKEKEKRKKSSKKEEKGSGEKREKKQALFVKNGEERRVFLARKQICVQSFLQEFKDIFPNEIPPGLPPLRGIEYQIDLVPGVVLPNRPAYRSNPQEMQEIQKQVFALINKGRRKVTFEPGDKFQDLRTNSSQEGGNDENIKGDQAQANVQDPLQGLGVPMTRARAKKAKEALNHMVTTLVEAQTQGGSARPSPRVFYCICQEKEHG